MKLWKRICALAISGVMILGGFSVPSEAKAEVVQETEETEETVYNLVESFSDGKQYILTFNATSAGIYGDSADKKAVTDVSSFASTVNTAWIAEDLSSITIPAQSDYAISIWTAKAVEDVTDVYTLQNLSTGKFLACVSNSLTTVDALAESCYWTIVTNPVTEDRGPEYGVTELDALAPYSDTTKMIRYSVGGGEFRLGSTSTSTDTANAEISLYECTDEIVYKTALQAAVDEAITDGSVYVKETWEVYAAALGTAKEVLVAEDVTREDVNAAIKALTEAKASLKIDGEVILLPVADTSVQSWTDEAGRNYGAKEYMQLQRDAQCDNYAMNPLGHGVKPYDSYDNKIALIKYDLTDVVPEGKVVERAVLTVTYLEQMSGWASKNTIEVALAESDWTEGIGTSENDNDASDGGVVWDGCPALYMQDELFGITTAFSDEFILSEKNQTIDIDVTELVELYFTEGKEEQYITFALQEVGNGNRFRIASREAGDETAAKLSISTNDPAAILADQTDLLRMIEKVEALFADSEALKAYPEEYVQALEAALEEAQAAVETTKYDQASVDAQTESLKTAMADMVESDDAITIVTASDYQTDNGNRSVQRLIWRMLDCMEEDGIANIDGFLFAGDYDMDGIEDERGVNAGVDALKYAFKDMVPEENMVLVQGNHDTTPDSNELSKSGNNDPESGDYGVFVINEDDYIWKGRSLSAKKATMNITKELMSYMDEKLNENYDKPIFVVSHLPLHYSMRTKIDGDCKYGNYIFDVLNEAGEKGLNIIFLFGHDHSSGWDDYIGGGSVYLNKGDEILIAQTSQTVFEAETLNFTYMNAGYIGYYNNYNGVDDALTMCVFRITDDQVTIARYDENGIHNLKAEGVRNTHNDETGYDPNPTVYSSPMTVSLTAVNDQSEISSPFRSVTTEKKILADFDFDDDADGAYFDGDNAIATGTYSLVDHEDGKAIELDGSSQYLTITDWDEKSLLTGCEEMTVSFECKPSYSKTNWMFFAAPNTTPQSYPYEHYLGIVDIEGTLYAERFDNSGSRPESVQTSVDYNDWHYVTVVYTTLTEDAPAETTLYIDGKEVSRVQSDVGISDLLGENSVLYLGKSTWGDNGEYATALIDNLKIYSYALSAEEVEELIPEKLELPYEDVKESDWFYSPVAYTYKENLMTGMDTKHFGPYGQLSRAQFALILYRMEGSPTVETSKIFGDVTGNEWYGQAVLWAAEAGIVGGYTDGNFGPADNITREQMALMMYRYAKYLKKDVSVDNDLAAFKDAGSVSGFAEDAIKWANGKGIITGKENGTMLDPQGQTARAEAAAIIQRFME